MTLLTEKQKKNYKNYIIKIDLELELEVEKISDFKSGHLFWQICLELLN